VAAPEFFASNLYVETLVTPRVARGKARRGLLKSGLAWVQMAADFTTGAIGMVAAQIISALCITRPPHLLQTQDVAPMSAAFAVVLIVLLHRDGASRKIGGLLGIRDTERAIRASSQALVLLGAIRLLLGQVVSWYSSLIALLAIPVLLILERQFLSLIVAKIHWRAEGSLQRAVIFGAGDIARSVVSNLRQSPALGFDPVAVIDGGDCSNGAALLEMGYRGRQSIPVDPRPLSASLLKAYRCEMLLVAMSNLSPDRLVTLTDVAHQVGADIAVLREIGVDCQPLGELLDVDGVQFITSRERPESLLYSLIKRVADILVSVPLIALLAPILALIWIVIRLDSPGPSIFVQKRIGRSGVLFNMFKFRTMFVGAPNYARSPISSQDPRITRIGRLLRRMSLDELPQLFNVLRGSMSLVGPRPEMPFIVEQYDSRQRLRLRIKPGITGLWQLSADRAFPIHENLEYDLYYIRNRNVSMDVAILIHTLIFALCGGV
jgi:exopolysaccharide biosynthesis polyprenyl glycosylphosphotransferase